MRQFQTCVSGTAQLTSWLWSPVSRTQMYLSLSMVTLVKVMAFCCTPRLWSCRQRGRAAAAVRLGTRAAAGRRSTRGARRAGWWGGRVEARGWRSTIAAAQPPDHARAVAGASSRRPTDSSSLSPTGGLAIGPPLGRLPPRSVAALFTQIVWRFRAECQALEGGRVDFAAPCRTAAVPPSRVH